MSDSLNGLNSELEQVDPQIREAVLKIVQAFIKAYLVEVNAIVLLTDVQVLGEKILGGIQHIIDNGVPLPPPDGE